MYPPKAKVSDKSKAEKELGEIKIMAWRGYRTIEFPDGTTVCYMIIDSNSTKADNEVKW